MKFTSKLFGRGGKKIVRPFDRTKELDMKANNTHEHKPQAGTIAWLNRCIERGKHEEFGESILLTPGLAGELLRRNPENRNIREFKAAQYASDIKSGNWKSNGETIIISDDGLLNDGQHRCAAVIEANTPIPVAMWFGVSRDTRLTIDQGAARGAGDYLAMDGVKNSTTCAVIARLVIAYERSGGTSASDKTITNAEVVARVHSDPSIAVAAAFSSGRGRKASIYVAATVIGFCYYIFSEVDEYDAEAFLEKVISGEGLKSKDPALTLREKLITMPKSREPKIAAIIRAWNFYRRGAGVVPSGLRSTLPFPAVL